MTVLSGRRALVTGGSRGIGAAIVQRLAANGAQVAFTYAASAGSAGCRRNGDCEPTTARGVSPEPSS